MSISIDRDDRDRTPSATTAEEPTVTSTGPEVAAEMPEMPAPQSMYGMTAVAAVLALSLMALAMLVGTAETPEPDTISTSTIGR